MLTFTSANWSTPQVVTLAAAGDADTANDSAEFSITSTGLATQKLSYTAIDAGGQSLILSSTNLNINEGGTNTFTVRLQDPPSGNVNVTVSRTAGDSDISVTGGTALTFTPQNYATPQTITIAAAEDADTTSDTATISVTAPSATTRTVSITEIDNDVQSPGITTTPDTTAVVNSLYTYDVDATGSPAPTFSLITFPTGMSIDSTTGVISWTPTVVGSVNVLVRAANGVLPNADQSYTITIASDTAPIATITTPTHGMLSLERPPSSLAMAPMT